MNSNWKSLVTLSLLTVVACSHKPSATEAASQAGQTTQTERTQAEESGAPDTERVFDEGEEAELGFIPEELPPKAFEMTPEFCKEWNPEFKYRGNRCCAKTNWRGKRRLRACAPQRRHRNLCAEATEAQLQFSTKDLAKLALRNIDQQAFCAPNDGFLVGGVPLLETTRNRVRIAKPSRCTNFGTTGLVLLLDRLGQKIANQYSEESKFDGVRMVVGDMSAPRGGCLATPRGSHSGHTNGLDADVAFLEAKPGQESGQHFNRKMDVALNWWLMKTIVEVSPVCVQYIFLDRKHIRALRKFAAHDPVWGEIGIVFKHVAGHRNHFHIRVGTTPRNGGPFACRRLQKEIEED